VDGNCFEKPICEAADGALWKTLRNAANSISKKALCLIERGIGLCKNFLSDRSFENKRNVKKVEKA